MALFVDDDGNPLPDKTPTIKCTSCQRHDFQRRYAPVIDERFGQGFLCAECFDEWLGVDRSRRKEEFRKIQEQHK